MAYANDSLLILLRFLRTRIHIQNSTLTLNYASSRAVSHSSFTNHSRAHTHRLPRVPPLSDPLSLRKYSTLFVGHLHSRSKGRHKHRILPIVIIVDLGESSKALKSF